MFVRKLYVVPSIRAILILVVPFKRLKSTSKSDAGADEVMGYVAGLRGLNTPAMNALLQCRVVVKNMFSLNAETDLSSKSMPTVV